MPHYTPSAPTVSVLMAVHDGDTCVRRAVESLRAQSLRNFELIVVDMGSRDGTLRILNTIAEREQRLYVVRAGRISRGQALQLALERAYGTYIVVMDADGWVEPSLLEDLVSAAEKNSLELVVGGYGLLLSQDGKRVDEVEVAAPNEVFPTQHDFRAAAWRLFGSGQLLPASGKLFVREKALAWDARFDDDLGSDAELGSDHGFVLRYLSRVERVGIVEAVHYHVERTTKGDLPTGSALASYRHLDAEHTLLLELYREWGFDGDAASIQMLQDRYAVRLMSCVEGACTREGSASASERNEAVAEMISSDRSQLAASVAKPKGRLAKALLSSIRSRNVKGTCLSARLVSTLSRNSLAAGTVSPDAYL